jgi:uncharacterized protein
MVHFNCMKYIQRDLSGKIEAQLASGGEEILLLSGARQTGKSTLAENLHCTGAKVIINLWDEEREVLALRNSRTFSEFEHILKSVFSFVPGEGKVLIVDEAQASEHLSSFLMEMRRKWRGQKVILLGSLLANLYRKGAPMPVGRTVDFVLRPLNFREFLRFRAKEHLLDLLNDPQPVPDEIHHLLMDEYRIYLQIGGLPGIVSACSENRDLMLLFESLLNNMYRDADRFIDPLSNSPRGRIPQYGRILETVMKSIAHHLGSPTQNTTLLSSDSPAYRTVLPHVLEALIVWHLAYSLSYAIAQPSTKKGYNSKKYLYDTGIANFLLTRLSPVRFGSSDQVAAMLLENGVLQDCISRAESINAVECYRSNNRVPSELDFVVTLGGKRYPVEVKSSAHVKKNTLSQLLDFMQRFGVNEGYVVYTGAQQLLEIGGKRVRLIPPYQMLDIIRETAD